LVAGRLKMGLGNELDLMNAETQLSLTKAAKPALEKAIKQSAYQLAILLGQKPGYLVDTLTNVRPQVAIPHEISINLPIDLLHQRPDIRAAERRLAAATADIGVATADLYPKFSLSGLLGLQSGDLSDLTQGKSAIWSLGPSFSLPLFDRGKIRANIEIRNARQEAALADYEQKALNALMEVESSLATFNSEKETSKTLASAVNSGQKAVEIANGLYQSGLSDFLNVLQSERALYQSQDQLAQSEQRLALSLVALFKALGGGWQAQDTKNIDTTPPTPQQ
jgi:outer membrane protein, multidrug efflux system